MKRIHNRLAILLIFALAPLFGRPCGGGRQPDYHPYPRGFGGTLPPLFFRQLVPGENSRFICGP